MMHSLVISLRDNLFTLMFFCDSMKFINNINVNLYELIVFLLIPLSPGRYFDKKSVRPLEKSVGFITFCIEVREYVRTYFIYTLDQRRIHFGCQPYILISSSK